MSVCVFFSCLSECVSVGVQVCGCACEMFLCSCACLFCDVSVGVSVCMYDVSVCEGVVVFTHVDFAVIVAYKVAFHFVC